jgi:hypothetical protein
MGSWMREWNDPNAMAHGTYARITVPFGSATRYIVRNRGTHMIYTDQENEWLSTPKQSRRVSNQTQDGTAPKQQDWRKHDWAMTTTIEIDGVSYVMPVQV